VIETIRLGRPTTVVAVVFTAILIASAPRPARAADVAQEDVPSDPVPEQKSVAGAWALEFFVGFGVGHYYAGSTKWGIVGTASSGVQWTGIGILIASVYEGGLYYLTPGIILTIIGSVGHTVSWIATISATEDRNLELREKFRSARGPSLLVPVLSLTF
jgi:hypothetical protein